MENDSQNKINVLVKTAAPYVMIGCGIGLLISIGGAGPTGT